MSKSKPELLWDAIGDKFRTPYANDARGISSGWNPGHLPGLSAVYVKIPDNMREEFLVLCLEFYLASARFLRTHSQNASQLFSNDVDAVRAEIDRLD